MAQTATLDSTSDLQRALILLKRNEGGFVDSPADPGGATKYGITLRALQQYYDRTHPGTKALRSDIVNLSWDTARAVYELIYWRPLACDLLPWPYCFPLFDYGVNSGVSQAARDLQRLVASSPDGQIGDATRKAIKAWISRRADELAQQSPEQLAMADMMRQLTLTRLQRNNDIRQTNKASWMAFIAGWVNRNITVLRML